MSPPEPAGARQLEGWRDRFGLTRGAGAAIATIVAVGIAASLLPPLLSLRLAGLGVSERTIGLLMGTVGFASLWTTPFATRIAARFGTANVIAAATPVAAILVPLGWFLPDPRVLFPALFIHGAVLALCYSLSEYWINAATPERRRGFIIGLYATLLSIGFAIGPGLVALLGANSIRPYLIGTVLMALSAIPALAARGISPDFREAPKRRFATFIFAVPSATLGVFAFAVAENAGFAFLPLWGKHLGYDVAFTPLLASAMTLGNVALQIPLGLLGDRIDRRWLLLCCGAIGAIGMVLAWACSGSPVVLIAILFVWGGVTAGIYTLGLAHFASRFSGADLAGANAAFVFCYAFGMLVGPLVVGDAMTRTPTYGLPLVLGTAFAIYTMIVAWRLASSRRALRRPVGL
jgi:MFS family permease